jgi:hypothetical protein
MRVDFPQAYALRGDAPVSIQDQYSVGLAPERNMVPGQGDAGALYSMIFERLPVSRPLW